MMRMFAGAIAVLLLAASAVWAQQPLLSATITSSAESNGADLENAVDTDGFTTEMQQIILDTFNANNGTSLTSIDEISDQALANTVASIIGNNADLTEQQATAIVRAAVRARPGAVVRIAAAAAYARPALALAFQNAANSVAPGQEEEVAAAVTRSASQGTTDDLNDDGVVDEEEDPSVT